ncbi:MAG: hypothetical protein JWQ71_1186 [Pedosphaera sp.]|nr:hypothetical protein [Pedosphaera sp.]
MHTNKHEWNGLGFLVVDFIDDGRNMGFGIVFICVRERESAVKGFCILLFHSIRVYWCAFVVQLTPTRTRSYLLIPAHTHPFANSAPFRGQFLCPFRFLTPINPD